VEVELDSLWVDDVFGSFLPKSSSTVSAVIEHFLQKDLLRAYAVSDTRTGNAVF
jgi:hypothetical protein